MNLESWFSTPIFQHDFTGPELAEIQKEIGLAVAQTTATALDTPWGDKTNSTFVHNETTHDIKTFSMVTLENAIQQAARVWCSQLNYKKSLPVLTSSWLNFAGYEGFQFDHKHPNNRISGCYYYQTTGDDGSIRFENPNTYALAGGFPFDDINADGVVYDPAVGRLILFPSWLTHRVGINKTSTERISLAFNLL